MPAYTANLVHQLSTTKMVQLTHPKTGQNFFTGQDKSSPLLPGFLLWVVHFCHFLLQGKLKPISCLPSYSDFNVIAMNYLQWCSVFCKQMPSQTLDGSSYPSYEFGGKFKNSYKK